jgi:general secretion pathway protein J
MPGNRGFTLLELVVAMGIFALLAVVAYGGLNNVLKLAAGTERQATRLGEVQLAVARLRRDVEQASGRRIRDAFGDPLPALVASAGGTALELTRAGNPNPMQAPRSSLQRVSWGLAGDELQRISWPVLDQPVGAETPEPESVLEGLESVEMRFLDGQNQWLLEWPPSDRAQADTLLPKAMELNLTLEDWGKIRLLVMVPQSGGEGAGDGTR